MYKKIILFSLFLITILSVTGYLTFSIVKKDISHGGKGSNDQIDFYMSGVNYVSFGDNGQPLNYLVTPLVKHYPEKDVYLFRDPKIKILNADKSYWLIDADMGKSLHGNDQVDLSGNVAINRRSEVAGSRPINITTDFLTYYPKKNYAVTDLPVKLVEPGSEVTSKGATVDFTKKTVNLLSQIVGQYTP